jgi:hypothetical protein
VLDLYSLYAAASTLRPAIQLKATMEAMNPTKLKNWSQHRLSAYRIPQIANTLSPHQQT